MKEHENKEILKEVLSVSEVEMLLYGYFDKINKKLATPLIMKPVQHSHLENSLLNMHTFLDSVRELVLEAETYAMILYELEEEVEASER